MSIISGMKIVRYKKIINKWKKASEKSRKIEKNETKSRKTLIWKMLKSHSSQTQCNFNANCIRKTQNAIPKISNSIHNNLFLPSSSNNQAQYSS